MRGQCTLLKVMRNCVLHRQKSAWASTIVADFCCLLLLTGFLPVDPRLAAAAMPPDFEADIAPLLIKRCVECHQSPKPSGNLLLTTWKGLQQGGDSGPALDFDSLEESFLLHRIQAGEMPPEKQGESQTLPRSEIAFLERWIAAGAEWPSARKLELFERTSEVRAGRDWWSLQPIQRPEVPGLKSFPQPANPIDAFILDRLEKEEMIPAPPADKRTLLRRLYYDLTGLPPTQTQIEQFESDPSALAWEKTIDELLDSPQYGVRWGRYWLDLVRYADTSGYERDQEKEFAWRYRDWVVDAFNSDLPYNRFVVEQLAGDELPDRSERTVIATGFLRLGTWNDEPNDPADYQYERLEDLVHTTSSAFLGMTVKCARCHSHKFDPISQEDYYRMASAFWAGPIPPSDRNLLGGPQPEELGFSEVLGWTDLGPTPPPLYILKNGERNHPLEEVIPASLSMIPHLEHRFDPPSEGSTTSERRLQLARWITDRDNPLTRRVLVNRLWLHHFGEAIVRSPNNFGFLASPPTHPELLDWLAEEFLSAQWSIKRMHKLILTSKTWQQSSLHPEFEAYQKKDAGNRLWWRAERRRLDAEALRDSILATTGKLDLHLGGPGFRPWISPAALEGLSKKSAAWEASPPEEQLRRSFYIYTKRSLLPPLMTTFDFCSLTQPCGQRNSTTLPTQALTLLNNEFVHGRSDALARKISAETRDPQAQVHQLWASVYGRDPSPGELELALQHLSVQSQRFEPLHQHLFAQSQRLEPLNQQQENQSDEAAAIRSQKLKESLVLHLQADQGVTLDSTGSVSNWKDQSGHHHHAWQSETAHRPRLSHYGFGGRSAISFDGEEDFLQLRGSLLQDQQCTIIAVVNDRGPSGHREILSNWNLLANNTTTSLFLGLTAAKTVRFSDAFSATGKIAMQNKPLVIIAVNGKSHSAVFMNSQELAVRETPLPSRTLSTDWVIGQQGNINGEYWNGKIAELRVYAHALSDDERLSVEREVSHRYTIPGVRPKTLEPLSPQALAVASLAHVLLNSNEFLYLD